MISWQNPTYTEIGYTDEDIFSWLTKSTRCTYKYGNWGLPACMSDECMMSVVKQGLGLSYDAVKKSRKYTFNYHNIHPLT